MRVLILGGTGEARRLAQLASGERVLELVSSLAGRVRDPLLPAGTVRVGGFGGADGLRQWLRDNAIDVVVDATHPFAAAIGAHAAAATTATGIPLLRLERPAWSARPGDRWTHVPDLGSAALALPGLGARVFLTIGRQGVHAFAALADPWFLIRAIDPPAPPLPPRHELILARGPFTVEAETALMAERRVDVLVTKNSGGAQTAAKLDAARALGLPVLVIDRPAPAPATAVVATPDQALAWLRTRAAG
ncbi:cobalt-precorrin-6A reductase [Nocardia farcinica]|uniref:cobalt-precorrin-6A reductase n=1 Tax=Nocardia farcinica TaxID=37329 RepID=UPI0014851F08|nr:cobalt-precorrin-6A reductase [Nocardia farcinica]